MNCGRIIVVTFIVLLISSGCNAFKTDEEIIEERINTFLSAYNSGDYEETLDCLSPKTKNTMKGITGVGETLLGGITGYNFNMSDLFGLGAGILSEDDILTVSDLKISFEDDSNATVNLTMTFNANVSKEPHKANFIMVKEDDDWYIKNIKLK